jgi:hypothetical protein
LSTPIRVLQPVTARAVARRARVAASFMVKVVVGWLQTKHSGGGKATSFAPAAAGRRGGKS